MLLIHKQEYNSSLIGRDQIVAVVITFQGQAEM